MKYYLTEIIPRLKKYSASLDQSALLVDKPWVVSSSEEAFEKLIFRSDGRVHLSRDGEVTDGKWEYLPEAQSLLIDYGNRKRLYRHQYLDEAVLALKIDSKISSDDDFYLLVDEKKVPDCNAKAYLENKLINKVEGATARSIPHQLPQANNNHETLRVSNSKLKFQDDLATIQKRKKLLSSSFEKGVLNQDEYNSKVGELESQQEECEKKISELEDFEKNVIVRLDEALKNLDELFLEGLITDQEFRVKKEVIKKEKFAYREEFISIKPEDLSELIADIGLINERTKNVSNEFKKEIIISFAKTYTYRTEWEEANPEMIRLVIEKKLPINKIGKLFKDYSKSPESIRDLEFILNSQID